MAVAVDADLGMSVGAAETTRLGVIPDMSQIQLHADAGLKPADIDAIATAGETPVTVAHYLGLTPKWVDGTAVGGCSFMIHVRGDRLGPLRDGADHAWRERPLRQSFWNGTRDQDVSQNYAAFLDAIEDEAPYSILDLGCGPGRDLSHFRSLGHEAVGLDGSNQFVAIPRAHSQYEVLNQDFLAMQLPESRFDGVFVNASLFHVPTQELPRVLPELFKTLKPRCVLFSSNPRGNNEESFADERYACYFDLDTWRDYVLAAGFVEVGHYYRPPGLPRHGQP